MIVVTEEDSVDLTLVMVTSTAPVAVTPESEAGGSVGLVAGGMSVSQGALSSMRGVLPELVKGSLFA